MPQATVPGIPEEISIPGPGEVQLWHIALDAAPDALAALRAILDDAERARADRFYRAIHGDRFTIGRGVLRLLLGASLRIPPEDVRFEYGEQGKPRLAEACNPDGIAFNLSHSDDAGILVISTCETVGVDIEARRESRDLPSIARRYFSAAEQAQFAALPAARQTPAFYHAWTCKEALLKAWGTGLSTPLDRFSVSLDPGAPRLLSLDLPAFTSTAWQLYGLDAPEGYTASMALPAPLERLEVRHWPHNNFTQKNP